MNRNSRQACAVFDDPFEPPPLDDIHTTLSKAAACRDAFVAKYAATTPVGFHSQESFDAAVCATFGAPGAELRSHLQSYHKTVGAFLSKNQAAAKRRGRVRPRRR